MKYKLLKEMPGYPIGYIFEEGSYPMDSFNKKAYPDFFEPIVERKRYEDLIPGQTGDYVWYIDQNTGEPLDSYFTKDCRSETFFTRQEAEDEHKRREWAVRPDKFIPEENEEYWYPTVDGSVSFTLNNLAHPDILKINLGLAFRTREECEKAIKEHDLIRLFYTIR